MRFAVINTDNIVVNVIEAFKDFKVPTGFRKIASDQGSDGDTWDAAAKRFIPNPVVRPPTPRDNYQAATTDAQRIEIMAKELGLSE